MSGEWNDWFRPTDERLQQFREMADDMDSDINTQARGIIWSLFEEIDGLKRELSALKETPRGE